MSKIFLGILTAHHPSRAPYRARARETFLKEWPAEDYKFFYGRSPQKGWHLLPDETEVDCNDRKEYMVLKNQAMFRYALDAGYDYCFRICDDTFVNVKNFREAKLEAYDYAGQMPCKLSIMGCLKVWMKHFDYMHGGCGIWLSRKAMEILVADKWPGPDLKARGWPLTVEVGFGLHADMSPTDWDDRWIGEVLKGNLPYNDPLRDSMGEAYRARGINVFEDQIAFLNDSPDHYLAVHDPGVIKSQDNRWNEVLSAQIKEGSCVLK